jgi:DNA invertase Pin-like site-specific DNA recombinase
MICAVYVRVSTKNQNSEMQLRDIDRFIAMKGWQKGLVYEDQMSGGRDDRPAFKRLMLDALSKRFQAVVVWKCDRFARSTAALHANIDALKRLDISFVSVTESFDLSTPIGEAMFGMLAIISQFERALIKERVNAGIKNAIEKRGGKWGRKTLEERLLPCARKQLDELLRSGMSYRSIARTCGLSATAVRDYVLRQSLREHAAALQRDTGASESTPPRSAPPSESQHPDPASDRQNRS